MAKIQNAPANVVYYFNKVIPKGGYANSEKVLLGALFLSKDLHNSKKSCIFAVDSTDNYAEQHYTQSMV